MLGTIALARLLVLRCFQIKLWLVSVAYSRRPDDDSEAVDVEEGKIAGGSGSRVPDGMCVECEDQPASLLCTVCEVRHFSGCVNVLITAALDCTS